MSIKKAELHVHLEGTISPQLAKKLAKKHSMSLPENLISPDESHYLSKDFPDFLRAYDTLSAVIQSPQDYYDITLDYLEKNALENTLYIEMMYSPDHAERASNIPSPEHLAAIQQAIETAEAKWEIVGRILITAVRHFGAEAAIRVAKQAAKNPFPCVTGFGLGGDEANFPPQDFQKAYAIAHDAGLFCTVHAGEFAPASGIIEAINTLPIQRIGHGVNAIYSPYALAMIKERDLALEICPSSNIFLKLFKDMASHPLPQFLEAGISVSINSDDPPFMRTSLAEEYKRVQQAYEYNDQTMHSITEMAIKKAFVDEETRKKLLEKLQSS